MTVLRVRLVALGFLALLVIGAFFLPITLGYTFLAGEKATAQVTSCHRSGRKLSCEGHWRGADGTRGSGHISGVDTGDVGHSVEVRIGPLGPYAGGLGRAWPLFLTVLPLPIAAGMLRRFRGRRRAAVRHLLAEPGDATILKVAVTWANGATGATEADGRPHSTLRTSEAPPGYRPLNLPGTPSRRRDPSALQTAAGTASGKTGFATAYGPAGEPLFIIERRAFGEYDPEAWLLDPAGTPQAMIRRTGPAEFTLARADGAALGTIHRTVRTSVCTARDQNGDQRAAMAAANRTWVLRIEPGTPPLLRDLYLAFLYDAHRLQQ